MVTLRSLTNDGFRYFEPLVQEDKETGGPASVPVGDQGRGLRSVILHDRVCRILTISGTVACEIKYPEISWSR